MSVCQHLPQNKRSSECPFVKDGGGLGVRVRGFGYLFIHRGMCQQTYFCVCVKECVRVKEQEVIQS